MRVRPTTRCPLCSTAHPVARLSAATWLAPEAVIEVKVRYPDWTPQDGACPNCARQQLQRILTERSLSPPRPAPHSGKLPAWECLPTPFRVGADPRFTGAGITMAMIDAAFFPHPDLVKPRNRIRAWVDVTGHRARALTFAPDEIPKWPGWDLYAPAQWHGQMASSIAAGNGRLSHGLYRGIASDADIILVQTMDQNRKITNATLTKALRWLSRNREELGIRIISFSVGGDPVPSRATNTVDARCERLLANGVVIVAACGNTGRQMLVPPCTCPGVIAVGGINDRDRLNPAYWRQWNSNYGTASDGSPKPDLVAPSWRVVAPILPYTSVAKEAKQLFARRLLGDRTAEARINDEKMVTPYYQHMDGTSVASPIVASTVACMMQANPSLKPNQLLQLLVATSQPLPDVPFERQGAGAVQSGAAVAAALAERFEAATGRQTKAVTEFYHDSI